jgi:hypothetical protein
MAFSAAAISALSASRPRAMTPRRQQNRRVIASV